MKTVHISTAELNQKKVKVNSTNPILKRLGIAILSFMLLTNLLNALLHTPEIETIIYYANRLIIVAIFCIAFFTALVNFFFFGLWSKTKSNKDNWKERMIEIEEI